MKPRVAFYVDIHDMTSVVFAETRDKAKWIAVKSFWEAGYGNGRGTWPYPRAHRAEHFDKSPYATGPRVAYSRETVALSIR